MAEAFQLTAGRDPGGLALSTPDGAATLTWAQYASQVRALAAALHAHGVRSGETVALMMANRPDFHVADTAAMHLGVASFSVYNTSSPAQVRFLLASARPRVVICDAAHAPRVLAAVPGSTVEHVVCIDGAPAGTVGLAEFISVHAGDFDFEAAWRAVRPSDVLTLIYTSGTTGQPKGVQITHENMLAEIAGTQAHLNAGPGDRVISFLPSAHIADRWAAQYLQVTCGTTVYPLADRTGLLTALTQVQPTMFGAVPQAWQKIRAAVTMMIDGEPDQARKDGIARAIKVGAAYVRARGAGTVPEDKEVAYRAADAVLRPIRSRLGLDQARIVMSGAAPIPPDVVEFFNALGIPLIDGWGMSELSCLAAFMPADRPRLGSVGKPLLGTQIRVLPDGEILVRGPIVMKGYLGLPQLTAEVLDADGWLHTGDIGRIDQDGYLFIVDRKKELLVTATGENLSPSAIEGRLKAATPLIGQAVVIGDKRPYVTALIVLDPDAAAQYVAARSLEPDSEALAGAEEVIAVIASAVDAANAAVAPVEHVRKFAILPEFWVPGSDVLTHTMKPRRRPIAERYGDVIDALYALPHDQSILHVRDVRDRTTAQA
jgi:long-subunit acyl-CoA synthetase (AMP-forming)